MSTKKNNQRHKRTAPIGMFDSGIGGLTVWKEVNQLLPNESIIYYADNAHYPYGPKSQSTIQQFCNRIVDFLLAKDCKLIVVACNTATAAAITHLRQHYCIPFVGMEPAVKPAALHTKTGKIGILATQGTLAGALFQETSRKFAQDVEVYIQIGTGLIAIVEENRIHEPASIELLRSYIMPMVEKGADHIVLGCTHYPFLQAIIEDMVGPEITILNPAPAVAKQVKRLLEINDLLAANDQVAEYIFHASGKAIDWNGVLKESLLI